MPSPVPKPADARRKRRDVAASQAAHRLPLTGRSGPAPKCPVRLGPAGRRWWLWAWSTPQATTWHDGFIEPLSRRAQLEDQWVAAIESEDGDSRATDLAVRLLPLILRIDEAFGLTPTGATKLHYAFVDEPAPEATPESTGNVTNIRDRLKGMRE